MVLSLYDDFCTVSTVRRTTIVLNENENENENENKKGAKKKILNSLLSLKVESSGYSGLGY
jgi:hypothetical protein